MEKIIQVDKVVQYCDICESQVGDFQITDKDEEHICFSCYDFRLMNFPSDDRTSYQKKEHYKFNTEKIKKLVLEEMKRQVQSGIGKYE